MVKTSDCLTENFKSSIMEFSCKNIMKHWQCFQSPKELYGTADERLQLGATNQHIFI